MAINNIDTFVIRAKEGTYNADKLVPTSKYDHINAWIDRKNGDLYLRVSAKVLKTHDDLGSITSTYNVAQLPPIIMSATGVEISAETLINSRLTGVDIKKDIEFDEPLPYVISALREMASISTSKNEILTYYSEVGYENSLLIKSTHKTVKDSLCIYNKFNEMYAKRNYDGGYYYSLSDKLEKRYKKVLRFERRIQRANALRKALKVPKGETVTLQHVLECKDDAVGNKVNSLTGNEIGGIE